VPAASGQDFRGLTRRGIPPVRLDRRRALAARGPRPGSHLRSREARTPGRSRPRRGQRRCLDSSSDLLSESKLGQPLRTGDQRAVIA